MATLFGTFRFLWEVKCVFKNKYKSAKQSMTNIKKSIKNSEFYKTNTKKITHYTDYIPYIDKLKNGYVNQICNGRPLFYVTTSGTSGQPKTIPFSINNQFSIWSLVPIPFFRPVIFYNLLFGKICYFFRKGDEKLYNGISCTNGITRQMAHVTNSFLFKFLIKRSSVSEFYQYAHENKEYDVMKIHAINALKEKKLNIFVGYFSRSVLEQFDNILENIDIYIDAIEKGEYRQFDYVYKFKPDIYRANELKKIFSIKDKKGWVKNVWPKLNLIMCGASGSFKIYSSRIKYYTNDIEIYSPYCACTEMIYGVDLYCNGSNDEYCIENTFGIIHMDKSELVVDEKYLRLCISTTNGLVSYMVDDMLEIHDNKNMFTYHGRYDFYEKIKKTEKQFVEELIKVFGYNLYDYIIINNNDKKYTLYCALYEDNKNKPKECNGLSIEYVSAVFFKNIIDEISKKVSSREQMKIPRIINDRHYLYHLFMKK